MKGPQLVKLMNYLAKWVDIILFINRIFKKIMEESMDGRSCKGPIAIRVCSTVGLLLRNRYVQRREALGGPLSPSRWIVYSVRGALRGPYISVKMDRIFC